MTNSEKAAYIRGLMEGMDLDPNAKETKLFNAIVDLLDDLSLSVEEMEDAYDELSGQVDEIDDGKTTKTNAITKSPARSAAIPSSSTKKCSMRAPSIARTAAKRWSSTSKKTIPAIAAKTATAIRNNFQVI